MQIYRVVHTGTEPGRYMQQQKNGFGSTENFILASLSSAERKRLEPGIAKVELKLGDRLFQRGHKAEHMYFPLESTMVSLLQVDANSGDAVEIGVIGREGLVGVHLVLGAPDSPASIAQVQLAGPALALSARLAVDAFVTSGEFRQAALRFAYVLLGRFAQTALCNRSHSIEERFARWILEMLDRTDSDLLPLTHDLVARMLGVTRSSVTLSAGIMQQAGLINIKRGEVRVLDRQRLEEVSCGCYAAIKGLHKRNCEF